MIPEWGKHLERGPLFIPDSRGIEKKRVIQRIAENTGLRKFRADPLINPPLSWLKTFVPQNRGRACFLDKRQKDFKRIPFAKNKPRSARSKITTKTFQRTTQPPF
jgi:hypothetical protein